MWLLMYDDGSVKLAGYGRRLRVTEVLNRGGEAHVFLRLVPGSAPRTPQQRSSDLVTLPRGVHELLRLDQF